MYYIMDTNIWVEVTQGRISCDELAGKGGARVVVAPFMIVELMKATVKSGGRFFLNDKATFTCMAKFDILELTKVFIFKALWGLSDAGVSKVRPETYRALLQMIIGSSSFADFIAKTEGPGSEWKRVCDWDSIHEGVLDKELRAVGKLADRASLRTIHVHVARLYRLGGLLPDPDVLEQKFSAALEYLRSSVVKVRKGANLAKKDPGMYVDFQLFFYLADPEAVVVSYEKFSGEIVRSPQRSRIITFDQFRRL
ncbi:MAG: hypothetical protein WA639_08235 [Candidatus Acidiferrum sp.]